MKKLSITTGLIAALMTLPVQADTIQQPLQSHTGKVQHVAEDNLVMRLRHIHQDDITSAELAARKSQNAAVKRYAQQVLADHQKAQKRLANISVTKLSEQQMSSPSSSAREHLAAINRMETLDGDEFDRDYLDYQFSLDHEAITSIDMELLRSPHDRAMRHYLNHIRSLMTSHMETARQLRAGL